MIHLECEPYGSSLFPGFDVDSNPKFCGHGRLFAKMTLEPGCSIGWHEHHGESETFYILAGAARYCDNGEWVTLRAGDCAYTPSGEGHSIANAGTQPLEFMALIVKA